MAGSNAVKGDLTLRHPYLHSHPHLGHLARQYQLHVSPAPGYWVLLPSPNPSLKCCLFLIFCAILDVCWGERRDEKINRGGAAQAATRYPHPACNSVLCSPVNAQFHTVPSAQSAKLPTQMGEHDRRHSPNSPLWFRREGRGRETKLQSPWILRPCHKESSIVVKRKETGEDANHAKTLSDTWRHWWCLP
jgi:hypothetical protein